MSFAFLFLTPAQAASPPSDTLFARELLRLNQPTVLHAAAEEAKGTPAEKLFSAQETISRWPEYKTSRAKQSQMSAEYLRNITDYLNSDPPALDGTWALQQSKFLIGDLAEPIINRIEYWGSSPSDRAALAPISALATRLLKTATDRLTLQLADLENQRPNYPSEEAYTKAYMAAYDAKLETDYYQCWAQYFAALTLPRTDPARLPLLAAAAKGLTDWADGSIDSGVKFQSLLLRGKIHSEANNILQAINDLTAASQAPDAPGRDLGWIRYQARYQLVVARLRGSDFAAANTALGQFKQWIDTQSKTPEAALSAQMLSYRVAWTQAETTQDPAAQKVRREDALQILGEVIQKDPRYKELVFEQLAGQRTPEEKPDTLLPLQLLALAWTQAQAPDDPPDTMKLSLTRARDSAALVRANKSATPLELREATLIQAVACSRLNLQQDAAALNLAFIDLAPTDPRCQDLLNLALSQLGTLRKQGINTPEVQALTQKALELATGKYNDTRWSYARATMLLDQNKLTEARAAFTQIPASDSSYYDAQYQLVLIELRQMRQLNAAPSSTQPASTPADQTAAAERLLNVCTNYLNLLASAPPATRQRMLPALVDLRLIQIGIALNPLNDPQAALAAIDALQQLVSAEKIELTPQQSAGILRYRITALSKQGDSQKISEEIKKLDPKQAPDLIKNLVTENAREIDAVQSTDLPRAKALAATVADLLETLISLTPDKKDAYAYKQSRADMLTRAGNLADSQKLWLELQSENPPDILNFLGEARALFAAGDYNKAADYFTRLLPKLPIGSESSWEAYLRIIQSKEALHQDTSDVKRTLQDLKIGNPENFGGKTYQKDFEKLAQKYGI